MEEIWAEGDEGRPLASSLLQVLYCSWVPGEKEGNPFDYIPWLYIKDLQLHVYDYM